MFPWPHKFTLAGDDRVREKDEEEDSRRVAGFGLLLVWPINKKVPWVLARSGQVECGRGFRLDSQRTRITKGAVQQEQNEEQEQQQELRLRDDPWCIICYLNHVTSWCPGGGCWERGREIIPRDSIYACLNVFDCALLIQIKLDCDSTSGCFYCCCCCGKLSLSSERTSISHFPACPWCCFLLVVVVQFQPHYNTFAFCSSQLNLRLLRDDWGGEGHQFQWQLAPVGINKVSAGRVSPPPWRIRN